MLKRIVGIFLLVGLLSGLVSQPILATPTTIPSGFSIIGAPSVWVDNPDETMTVYESQTVVVTVEMPPGSALNDLFTLRLAIHWDEDGVPDGSLPPFTGGMDSKHEFQFYWEPTGWTISDPGSWSQIDMIVPPLEQNIGDFIFTFVPGTEAQETTGVQKWHFGAEAIYMDEVGPLYGVGWDAEGATTDLYTEIYVFADQTEWGGIRPDTAFTNTPPSQMAFGVIDLKANGAWGLSVNTSNAIWGASYTENPATMVVPDSLNSGPNQFSILVGLANILDPITLTYNAYWDSGNNLVLSASPQIIDTGINTGPYGYETSAIYMWLATSEIFSSGYFDGEIIFNIGPA